MVVSMTLICAPLGFSQLVPYWFPISEKRCWNLLKMVTDFGPKFSDFEKMKICRVLKDLDGFVEILGIRKGLLGI